MEKRVPAVYTAEEVAELLNMKKSTGYTYIKEVYEKKNAFPVYKICGQYRIPKKAFHIWLEGYYLCCPLIPKPENPLYSSGFSGFFIQKNKVFKKCVKCHNFLQFYCF